MNEFWALVLGSVLATGGGIIGTMITNWMQKRKDKEDEKRKAYINLLIFCHRSKYANLETEELCELFAENVANVQLFASVKVQTEFIKINELLVELYDEGIGQDTREKKLNTINALIGVLAAQIKKETGLSDENSKKLLKRTLEKRRTQNE